MSEPKDDGGPAFPTTRLEHPYQFPYEKEVAERSYPGLSIRDYFAGQALAGIFANEAGLSRMRESPTFSGEMIALAAYAQADAMLRMRGQP